MSTSTVRQPVTIGQALALALGQIGQCDLAKVALQGKQPQPVETFEFDDEVVRDTQVRTNLAIETNTLLHRKSRKTKGRTRR